MHGLRQRLLLRLCQFDRMHQSYPGRWRACHFLVDRARHLAALAPMEVKMAEATFIRLDPREKFDGLKAPVCDLNAEEPQSNLMLQILRPGDAALDIGANVGCFAALASQAVGPQGSVHAFEASPAIYARLQTSARHNRWKSIRSFPVATSNQAGEVDLYSGPVDHTGTPPMRDLGERPTSKTRIQAIAVDDLLDQLPTVRLIKIDVEGAESLVPQSMTQLLNHDRPNVLMEGADSFPQTLGSDKIEVIRLYENLGNRAWRVDHTVVPYQPASEYQCDVLPVPPGAPAVQFNEQLFEAAPR